MYTHPLFYFMLFIRFWAGHPALLYGISFLLGFYAHLYSSITLFIPCAFLWIPFILKLCTKQMENLKQFSLSILIFVTAWVYVAMHHPLIELPEKGAAGYAQIHIQNLQLKKGMFGEKWIYTCQIKKWIPSDLNGSTQLPPFSSLPCMIFISKKQAHRIERPLANQDYWVSGKLSLLNQGGYQLKTTTQTNWIPIQENQSMAEKRFQWKREVSKWIQKKFSHRDSASFLAGLATGEFDDYTIRDEFARFGLQHILAISGFHFAIVAGFLHVLLRLCFARKKAIFLLLILLGSYCYFLGSQPSIIRAWIMCSLTLIGTLVHKQTTAMNSLGIALLLILAYDPFFCLGLPFQLSFATTFAILLFYPVVQRGCVEILPKRRLIEMLGMNSLNQHGYCILSYLRSGLALTIAVNALALPLTLYYFQQFPLLSLLYNLFFPLFVSGSLCLLILGIIFSWIPFLGSAVHTLNSYYTNFLLHLTFQVPSEVDTYLSIGSIDPLYLTFSLCCLVSWGIIKQEQDPSNNERFAFI